MNTSNHLRPIAFNRKVLSSEKNYQDGGIDELFDLNSKTHVIRFSGRPDQWMQYKELEEVGITMPTMHQPVFGYEHTPEDFELVVPRGSASLDSQLEMIARDVPTYSEIFFVVGDYLAEIHSKTGLIPTSVDCRGILASILLYSDQSLSKGLGALLVPPFYLELKPTTKSLRRQVVDELMASTVFSEDEVEQLRVALKLGLRGD